MATMIEKDGKDGKSPQTNIPPNGKESSELGSVDGLDVLGLATDEHPAHPRNWSLLKRWSILATLCTFQAFMYSPMY